jgi:GAF domain-containing protein
VSDVGAEHRYREALESLSRILVDADELRDTLEQLLEVAAVATPEVTALTITAVGEDGDLHSAASTEPRAQEVDEREFAIDQGPCIDALASGQEQLSTDTSTEERWPGFVEVARAAGFGSVAGLPLRSPEGTVIGALNVFGDARDGISEASLAVLRRVCGPAAAVLANARAYRRSSALGERLSATLEERAVVNRAVGVVVGRHGGDPDAILARLRARAEHDGLELHALAERVLAGEVDLGT